MHIGNYLTDFIHNKLNSKGVMGIVHPTPTQLPGREIVLPRCGPNLGTRGGFYLKLEPKWQLLDHFDFRPFKQSKHSVKIVTLSVSDKGSQGKRIR